MRDNYIQAYERQITNQKQRIGALQSRSQHLEKELQSVKMIKDQYELILQRDSVTRSYVGMAENSTIQRNAIWDSFQIMEQRLQISQSKIKLLDNQLHEYKNLISKRQNQISRYQIGKKFKQNKIKQLQNENYKIREEFNRRQYQINRLNEAITQNRTTIQTLRKNNLQLEIEKRQNSNKMSEQFLKQVQTIKQTSNNWLLLNKRLTKIQNQSNSNSNQENKQLLLNLKKQQHIMEEMGQQLDERNMQLAQHISNQVIDQNVDNHKSQIRSLEQQRKKKQKMYRELLQKYQIISKDFKRLVNANRQIQSQYNSMKTRYEQSSRQSSSSNQLKKQVQSYKGKCQMNETYIRQVENRLQQALKQNEVLHNFMYAIHKSNYPKEVQNEIERYIARLKNRTDQVGIHWTNVTELLRMNRKLTEICRMKN